MFLPKLCGVLVLIMLSAVSAVVDKRLVPGFEGINASGAFHVTVHLNGQEQVVIDAPNDDVLNKTVTVVENGVLIIRFRDSVILPPDHPFVRVAVFAKILTNIALSGVCNIAVSEPIESPTFYLSTAGNSAARVTLKTSMFNAEIVGASLIDVDGTTRNANIQVQGTAQVNGFSLIVNDAQVMVQGAGVLTLHVQNQLSGLVQGVGSVSYRGRPNIAVQTQGMASIQQVV